MANAKLIQIVFLTYKRHYDINLKSSEIKKLHAHEMSKETYTLDYHRTAQ